MGKPVILIPQTTEQPGFEGEFRDVLRRADQRELRREQHNEVDAPSAASRENLTELVGRVAGTSTGHVERVVIQLQSLTDQLHSERERVNGEIAGYIKLNDHATRAMQAISAALKQLSDAIPTRQA